MWLLTFTDASAMPVATQQIRAADDWEACEIGHGILEAGTYPCAVDFILDDLEKTLIKIPPINPAFIDASGEITVLENSLQP